MGAVSINEKDKGGGDFTWSFPTPNKTNKCINLKILFLHAIHQASDMFRLSWSSLGI